MGLTDQDWIGSAVSLTCDDELGVFQGQIQKISAEEITIVRAFRNGVPLRKQNAEVVLRCSDIRSINLIEPFKDIETTTPTVINRPTPVKLPNFSNILGKQQKLQLQQKHPHNHNQANGENYPSSNSALNNNMQQMMLNLNLSAQTGTQSALQNSRTSSAQQQQQQQQQQHQVHQMATTPKTVSAFFGNMIPSKVEVKLGCAGYSASGNVGGGVNHVESYCSSSADGSSGSGEVVAAISKPIDIIQSGNSGYFNSAPSNYSKSRRNTAQNVGFNSTSYSANGNGNGNAKNKQRNRIRRESSIRQQQEQTFGSEADDPLLREDFDFEGNLALFDKQAIWDDIESTHQKPDLVRHAVHAQKQHEEKKYRHDENILASKPLQLRQIQSMFDGSKSFVTDDGLIIPTIPAYVRQKIELSAEKAGLSQQRQIDLLARGASDLAITLLGGARRLTPANNHQWPKIAIICEEVNSVRASNIGCATGRHLASHGLTVFLYLGKSAAFDEKNISSEISLFKATDSTIVHSLDALPTTDLVILSSNTYKLSDTVKKWISINRSSILAVDPPPSGIQDVGIKYSIFPILPLIQEQNNLNAEATLPTATNICGKLYLCNLGIPVKFYRDCGIKYKSPYGHKDVIPIHSRD
ncbi:Edc3 [Drosophila busckii]|uniref:Edc3 n=1 Tax=Drosophila busckii TaxID=30019 RepID=A0A0M4EJ75_DROBS|nr:enhancer of mRNA-decapping protein 3 [Drosophila busckii]ALC42985.1 Edc3 [Drosophila busckii]